MKTTLLFAGVLGLWVTGLQGGEYMDAALANEARANAILTAPVPGTSSTQDKILEELKKQTAIMQAQQPVIVSDPAVKPVPVTIYPTR